jgi:hypothetical protein
MLVRRYTNTFKGLRLGSAGSHSLAGSGYVDAAGSGGLLVKPSTLTPRSKVGEPTT